MNSFTKGFCEVAQCLPATSTTLIGENKVWRSLPRRAQRRVGPFVFCDHFGPTKLGQAPMSVPAHPHCGLQTVTYLLSGSLRHTDSIGSVQIIQPGDVNWMTAGAGIVHAEETLSTNEPLHLIQTWVGLPQAHRKTAPAFEHYARDTLPSIQMQGATIRVLAGALHDARSPVHTFQATTYLDIMLSPGSDADLTVDPSHELAAYVIEGTLHIGSDPIDTHALAVLTPGDKLRLTSATGARVLLLGGEPLPEPTVIWWNFVVDSLEEGKAREADWHAGRFAGITHT